LAELISKDGLGKWMLPMILAMHLPILGFVSLAHFHPSSVYYIYATVIAEQFGYGFWLCCLYDVFDLCG
jgi:PAT family beta-lactamase induction signal transducer AmpG